MFAASGLSSTVASLRQLAAGATAILPFLGAGWVVYQNVERSRTTPLHAVTGRVTLEGAAVPSAIVRFHPLRASDLIALTPAATANENGSFDLHTPLVGQGAPAGEYRVTVTSHPHVIDGEDYHRGPNVLPRVYAVPHTSTLRARIVPGDNHIELALSSREQLWDPTPNPVIGKERLP